MSEQRYLCILDTMWSDRAGRAPKWYCINPKNHSGSRLYRITGEESGCLWCTNVCKELVTSPHQHGQPDVLWLKKNLEEYAAKRTNPRWEWTYLVCGVTAQTCFEVLMPERPAGRVVFLPHPAARNWTRLALRQAAEHVQEGRADLAMRIVDGRLRVRRLADAN